VPFLKIDELTSFDVSNNELGTFLKRKTKRLITSFFLALQATGCFLPKDLRKLISCLMSTHRVSRLNCTWKQYFNFYASHRCTREHNPVLSNQ
jgi:hypothetical protein